MPSIEHYIGVDPGQREVLHFRRKGDALVPPEQPVPEDRTLHLHPPGTDVPVVDLLGPAPLPA